MTRVRSNRATTLIEMVVAIAVLGVIAGVSMPVVHGAIEAYAGAARARRASEQAAFAMERITRLFRDAPVDAEGLRVREATAGSLVFDDGRGVQFEDSVVYWVEADGARSPLCEHTNAFTIGLVGADGRTDTTSDPSMTHRVHVTLNVDGFELRTCVLPRGWVTP